jgi:hypothetical protein
MLADSSLETTIIVAALTMTYILVRHWRSDSGTGLLLTYLLSFGTIHLLAPVLYLIPWYGDIRIGPTLEGLRESTTALIAFAVGAEIGARLAQDRNGNAPADDPTRSIDARQANVYLLAGLFIYAVMIPASRGIPTLTALVSMALPMIVGAMGAKCWAAWREGRQGAMWTWVAMSIAFPVLTVLTQGFLGFGFASMLTLFAFVASYYRPQWKVLVAGLALAYIGLSVYVTYMRDRTDIRNIVWTGGTLRESAAQASDTFGDFEWFDPNNVKHLDRIDGRLNQDLLIGMAVDNLEVGTARFAAGSTIVDAVLAVVPRALWPDKPVAAGSGDLVADFTGLRFPEGTSVGIGQVMECYVNFGTTGVLVGFLLIGGFVAFIDRTSLHCLRRGDLACFMVWYLPGLAFLQVGGSFVELGGVAASGFVVARLFRYLTPRKRRAEAIEPVVSPFRQTGAAPER